MWTEGMPPRVRVQACLSAGGPGSAPGRIHGRGDRRRRLPRPAPTTPRRSAAPPVGIADSALRAAIEGALGRPAPDPLTAADLAALRVLNVRGAGVSDLSGPERAVNLSTLDIGLNPVVDLRVLADLPAPVAVNADGTAADPRQLSGLQRVRHLSLRNSGLVAMEALRRLANLHVLDVGRNRIANLHPLSGMVKLEALRADGNRIADLSPLASLTNLRVLDLRGNRISDAYPLSGLPKLRRLDLRGNVGVVDLHQLAEMPGRSSLVLERAGTERTFEPLGTSGDRTTGDVSRGHQRSGTHAWFGAPGGLGASNFQ